MLAGLFYIVGADRRILLRGRRGEADGPPVILDAHCTAVLAGDGHLGDGSSAGEAVGRTHFASICGAVFRHS